MGPIFPTYLGHLHDERLSNRWFRCFAVIRLTNPPYIIIMWKISSTGYMKKKKTDFKCTVHVLIFQLSFSVCGCNQVPLDSSTSLPFFSSLILVFFSFPLPLCPAPHVHPYTASIKRKWSVCCGQSGFWLVGWADWILMPVIRSDRGQGTNTCHMSTPLPHTPCIPHHLISFPPPPFNWENMESVLDVKVLEHNQPYPPSTLAS